MPSSPIIVALDYDDITQARQFIASVSPDLCRLKIGKQMFTQYGPGWVKECVQQGFDVFLDLKYHDIPNTVAKACSAAAKLGVWMLNVHASGGLRMMQAAKTAVDEAEVERKPLLIGVTVLTSMEQDDINQLGIVDSVEVVVERLAKLAQQAGLEGVVCSAQEASLLRQQLNSDFCLVTPGIQLASGDSPDQKRVMTPEKALGAGADYLVIGRSITQSDTPQQTLEAILRQIA